MAHPLGARFDIAHGVANALLLPFVMEYNMQSAKAKYADIARAMGVDVRGLSEDDAANAAIDAVKELSKKIGIPQRLQDIGIKETDLPMLAKDAIIDPCTGGNPAPVTEADVLAIYKKAF
jgi:lactaldehyde reductase